MAEWSDSDVVLNGIHRVDRMAPTLAALHAGKPVALAKESLIAGGPLWSSRPQGQPDWKLR